MQSLSHIARGYYTAMKNKDLATLEQHLHPDVLFIGPMAEMTGKNSVATAAKNFMNFFNALEIRHILENSHDSSAVVVFDLICPAPIGTLRAATFMHIEHNLITKMELFYDARPFEKKREEIFSR